MTDRIITIVCTDPECAHDINEPLSWLQANNHVVCTACGQTLLYDAVRFFEEVSLSDPKILEKFKALVRFKVVHTRKMDS